MGGCFFFFLDVSFFDFALVRSSGFILRAKRFSLREIHTGAVLVLVMPLTCSAISDLSSRTEEGKRTERVRRIPMDKAVRYSFFLALLLFPHFYLY